MNDNFVVGVPSNLQILCTPIDNIHATTRLADAIQQLGDGVVADGIRELSTFLKVAVVQDALEGVPD